jgi:cytochrome c oxidase subunit 2
MRTMMIALFAMTAACGGDEPAPAPAEPAPAPEAPKEAKAKAKAEPAPAADVDLKAMSPEELKTFLMTEGEKVYTTGGSGGVACVTCHMANGEGLPPSFPPLKGAGSFYGDCTNHAGLVVKGLTGEIEVNGVKYNGAMPAQANLSDLEIAAVITYERNSWGNDDGICKPKDVMAAR